MKKFFLSGAIALSLIVFSTTVSHAQPYIWDGGGAPDGNFGTAANWNPDAVPVATSTFIFDGGVGLNATNNITLTAGDNTLNFTAGASAFNIWGNNIRIGGINNTSAVMQTIDATVVVNGARTINVGTAGMTLLHPVGSTGTSGRTVTKTGTGDLTIGSGTAVSGGSAYSVSAGGLIFSGSTATSLGSAVNGIALTANGTKLTFNNAGTLAIGGAITTVAGSSVILNNAGNVTITGGTTITGASLTGTGHLLGGGVTVVGGSVAPGNSGIGTIFAPALSLDSASTTTMEINRAGEIADLISASSTLTLGGALTVNNIGATLISGDSFNLFDGTISSTFNSTTLPTLDSGLGWDVSQLYTTGIISVEAVPEPSSLALMGLGLGLVALQIRRLKVA